MRCIAHRGFAGVNPENTLPAVRAAVDAGADCVEVDVRRCGSGELVVVHDERLDRITGATGVVGETPLSTLSGLDVLGSGASIPTLDAVVAATPADVGLNVELKERGLVADLLDVVDRHDTDVLVSSFDAETLRDVAARGDLQLAVLIADDPAGGLDLARELDCRAVHPHRRFCDASFVETAHELGVRVNAWTVREAREADRLASLGIDGLIADDPAVC